MRIPDMTAAVRKRAKTVRPAVLAACLLMAAAVTASSQTVTIRGIAHNYGTAECACFDVTVVQDGDLGWVIVRDIPAEFLERHIQVTGTYAWCADAFCPPGRFILHASRVDSLRTDTVRRVAGWNMVSMPLLLNDSDRAAAFQEPDGGPTAYRRGYVREDSVRPGRGYWIRSADSAVAELTGIPVEAETVEVEQGWNMVGSACAPLPVSEVLRLDSTLTLSLFYTYDPASEQYVVAGVVVPWSAYWVKANHSGAIVLRNPAHAEPPASAWPVRIVEEPADPPPRRQ